MARRKSLFTTYVDTIDEISPKCKELKNKYGENSCTIEVNEMTVGGQRVFLIEIWG